MIDSKFARGIVASDSESIRTQVALWDDMKLWKLLWRKARDSVQEDDIIREELNEKVEWLGQFSDSEVRVMLLTRVADHLDLELPSQLTAGELDDLGDKIEKGAVALLKENDGDFEGDTTAEMAQHVMLGLFDDLADKFEDQDEETQQEIVEAIMEEIESMPKKQRERLREELDADELGVLSGYVQNVNIVETLHRPGPVISAPAVGAGRPCPRRTARSVSDAWSCRG
jgi:hypothetical protein